MSNINHVFYITPIFEFAEESAKVAGLYPHYNNAKETMQLFMNEESYKNGRLYIGAIQYEGSNDYKKREPHIVSWRFKRANISNELKQELELITSFRRDKNKGPTINREAESIAFKYEELNEASKETMHQIVRVLRKYT